MKDQISTWIDSTHDHLNINKDDYYAFDDSAIALPTILNSPPDSVKSLSSNDDADCSANLFQNNSDDNIEAEKSFNFVDDTLRQPMKNSQDILYAGPTAFQMEIATLADEQDFNYMSDGYLDLMILDKNDDDMMQIDKKTPIVGNDLMFGERQIPNQMVFKQEINTEDTTYDMNMNKEPVHKPQAKLLARRTVNRPQVQLKIQMAIPNGDHNYITEDPIQTNNAITMPAAVAPAPVISTPQLINEILEKEYEGKFDLVNYIDADNVSKKNALHHFVRSFVCVFFSSSLWVCMR